MLKLQIAGTVSLSCKLNRNTGHLTLMIPTLRIIQCFTMKMEPNFATFENIPSELKSTGSAQVEHCTVSFILSSTDVYTLLSGIGRSAPGIVEQVIGQFALNWLNE